MKNLRYYINLVEEEEFKFSPEQEKYLGGANRQDPHILKDMPGPKPPISYFKDPEDQAIAKQLNFGRQNLNTVTQALGGQPGEPETFKSRPVSTNAPVVNEPTVPDNTKPAAAVDADVATTSPTTVRDPIKVSPTTVATTPPEKNEFELQRDGQAGTGGTAPQQTSPTKKVPAPVDEKLKSIQEKLKAMGYNLGPTGVDGRMGKYTRQAIDDYKAGTLPSNSKAATTLSKETIAQLQVLKKQAGQQRAAGDKDGAIETERAMAQISTPTQPGTSGAAAPAPAAPAAAPAQPQQAKAALDRLSKQFKLDEGFNKLTPIEQIQKIRQIVDEAEIIVPDRSGGVARDAGAQARMQTMQNANPAVANAHNPFGIGKTVAADAASSTAGKVAKAALGTTWKKIAPGAGLAFGAQDAYTRGKEGDWLGAGIAGASAIASLLPGPGTAIALGLDAANIARDYAAGKFDDAAAEVTPEVRAQTEQDWKTLKPYLDNQELFKSLSAEDQARLTKLKQKAAELARAAAPK